jgi:hypothetical protein
MHWWWQEFVVRAKWVIAREILIIAGLFVVSLILGLIMQVALYMYSPFFPIWMFLYVLRWLGWAWKVRRGERVGVPFDRETRCRQCAYILRGIPEPRCPECGEKI